MFDDVLVCVCSNNNIEMPEISIHLYFYPFFFADGKIVRLLSVECRVDWGEWNGF